jgi:L-lactate dehydrogenase complex protein LldG
VAAAIVTSSRELILARVRTAMPSSASPAPATARAYRHSGRLSPQARVELLCERISDYRATVRRVDSGELRDAIADAFATHAARHVVIPVGLPPAWRPEQMELIEDHGFSYPQLDAFDGVLTGATVAIAQTGTLILSGGAAEGRRALTLIPDLHVCVIEERQIVELVPEAIAQLASAQRRPLTLISGPSATSDIELRRVEGVHGPRKLTVLVAPSTPR